MAKKTLLEVRGMKWSEHRRFEKRDYTADEGPRRI